MNPESPQDLHEWAMDRYMEAEGYERNNNHQTALHCRQNAFQSEKEAALICHNTTPHPEPTRTILFRSAGWIAFKAGMIEEAKEMLKMAKEGDWEHDADNVIELEEKIEKQQNKNL